MAASFDISFSMGLSCGVTLTLWLVHGSWSEASLGKGVRSYLKNKLKGKGLVEWLKW
jgi:hypothetical protein